MTTISLTTLINAPIETCFDVSRDVKVHERSTTGTNERAIAGRTVGLCELGDTITWQATHFGIRQKLTSKITRMTKPYFFEDAMLKGAFKSMRHEHRFEIQDGRTVMRDVFMYEVPLGFIGTLVDRLILKKYMTNFLVTRNEVIKQVAERTIV